MFLASAVAITHRTLAPVDLAIIGVYFAIVFSIGFYFSRKERTSEDYFLASRDVGWFAIGASLFVSNISTEHFIGLAGSGATSGLAVGHFEWLACLILLILGWAFDSDPQLAWARAGLTEYSLSPEDRMRALFQTTLDYLGKVAGEKSEKVVRAMLQAAAHPPAVALARPLRLDPQGR